MPSAAAAQDDLNSDDQENEGNTSSGLGAIGSGIIVTARKREEDVQDTPIAISAFSGESLDARGITSIESVGGITPNVTYQNNPAIGGSSSVSSVYIRGIGQRDFLGTIDNGSGFYIDDIVIGRTVGAVVDLLDIDRVEVLRGPQGTLNGRNNIGGAVKIFTKKPDYDGGGYIDLTYGTDNLVTVKGSINAGLSDTLAVAATGLYKRQDGYVDRPAGGDLGNSNLFAFRGALLWEPTDSLEVNLSAEYSDADDNGPAFVLIQSGADVPGSFAGFYNNLNSGSPDCAGPGGITSTNPICFNDVNFVPESQDVNFGTAPTFSRTRVFFARADIRYDISDDFSIRSITGYRDLDAQFARDADGSPNTVVHFFDDFQTTQFSQELQLNATLFDGAVDFVLGGYYFNEDGNNLNVLEFAIANFDSGSAFGTDSLAVYSQATWHITDTIHLTLGGRYTDEDKTFFPDQIVGPNFLGIPFEDATGACVLQDRAGGGPFAPIVPVPAAACPVRQLPNVLSEQNTTEFTPMANLAFDVTEDLLVYVNYSEGFRSGGFAQRVFPPLPFAPSFGPEFAESYEAGFKFQTDGLTLNSAIFQTDYSDIQAAAEIPGFIGLFESNVGNGKITGFEAEAILQPTEGLVFELSYGYLDARYTEITVPDGLTTIITLDTTFDKVPEHSFSGAVSKEFLFDSGASLIARLDGQFTTEYANDPDNSPQIFTPDVGILNASLRWLSANGNYTVTAGVKNLTDNEYLQSGYLAEAIATSDVIFARGREFYASLRVNF
ncbi:MAG: TonB-dependent receptor [Erythrobacter sp.]